MRIAITSRGNDLDSAVDARFGRAEWFVYYDTDTKIFEAANNEQQYNLPQGAGIQAATQVIDKGANVLLTGHCGPNAFQTLSAAGVNVVVNVGGRVKEVIEKFENGHYKPTDSADVEGHW